MNRKVVTLMGKYTTEVRFICECAVEMSESAGANSVREICLGAAPVLFREDLELFDDDYKQVLFPKILMHYYTREIAFETVGLWVLKLNTKMQEILPFYNQLYRSETLKFDPLHPFNLSRTHVEQGKNQTHTTGTQDGEKLNLFSDTPQGGLDGIDDNGYKYLTNAAKSNGTSTMTDSSSSQDGRFWQELVKGVNGENQAQLLLDFRKTMLNIDMQVIDELSDLFFKLW